MVRTYQKTLVNSALVPSSNALGIHQIWTSLVLFPAGNQNKSNGTQPQLNHSKQLKIFYEFYIQNQIYYIPKLVTQAV